MRAPAHLKKLRKPLPIGERFGRLTVLRLVETPADYRGNDTRFVECICDCGTLKNLSLAAIKGATTSCGCAHHEMLVKRNTSHGMTKSKMYGVWASMINRCHNKRVKCYPNYGGRGVSVCDRWKQSFESFYQDVGDAPEGKSLDRVDNDGPYSPENVRWATQQQQAENSRKAVKVGAFGKTQSPRKWSEEFGVPASVIRGRLKTGWSPEDAVSKKPRPKYWAGTHTLKS